MSVHQSALGLIAIVFLTGSCATVAGQSKYQAVVTSSFDVAGYVEHHRTLPESIEAVAPIEADEPVAAAGARYCSAAADCIVIDGPWRERLK